ncbi:MAG: hypothetical protein ACRDHW_02135 [Ktedonobacteraceae bacterium]
MSDKPTGKEIGGIQQFAKFGGSKPVSPVPSPPQSQKQEPEAVRSTSPTKEKAGGKPERLTIYAPPEVAEWVRFQVFKQRKTISEIVVASVEASMQQNPQDR